MELPSELAEPSRSVAPPSCPHGTDRAAWQQLLLRNAVVKLPCRLPGRAQWGKVSIPGGKSFLQAAPCSGCWSCSFQRVCAPALRAPFPRGFSSQQLGATKGEIWLQPGTAWCLLRTSQAPYKAAMGAVVFPQGRRGVWAHVMALLRVLEHQPRLIKNTFAGNPAGFPVM